MAAGRAAGLDMMPRCTVFNQAEDARGWRLAADAMGIDWMTRQELAQAIPPVYTEFIGKALLAHLGVVA